MADLINGDILVGTTVDGRFKIIFRPVNQIDPPLPARVQPTPSPSVRTFSGPAPPRPPPPVIVKEEPESPESPPPSPPFLVMEKPAAQIPPVRQIPPPSPPPPTTVSAASSAPSPSVEVTVERAEPIGVRVTTRTSQGSSSRIYPDVPDVRPHPSAPPLEEFQHSPSRGIVRGREESPMPVRNTRQRVNSSLGDVSSTVDALARAVNEVETISSSLLNFAMRPTGGPPPVTPSPSTSPTDPPRIVQRRDLRQLTRPRPLLPSTRRNVDLTPAAVPVVTTTTGTTMTPSTSPYSDITVMSTVSSPPAPYLEEQPYFDHEVCLSDELLDDEDEFAEEMMLYDNLEEMPPWSSTPPLPCHIPTHRVCVPSSWGQVCPGIRKRCLLCHDDNCHHAIQCRGCGGTPGCCRCIWTYMRSRYNSGCPLCRHEDPGEDVLPQNMIAPSLPPRRGRGNRGRGRPRGSVVGRSRGRGRGRGRRSPPPEDDQPER